MIKGKKLFAILALFASAALSAAQGTSTVTSTAHETVTETVTQTHTQTSYTQATVYTTTTQTIDGYAYTQVTVTSTQTGTATAYVQSTTTTTQTQTQTAYAQTTLYTTTTQTIPGYAYTQVTVTSTQTGTATAYVQATTTTTQTQTQTAYAQTTLYTTTTQTIPGYAYTQVTVTSTQTGTATAYVQSTTTHTQTQTVTAYTQSTATVTATQTATATATDVEIVTSTYTPTSTAVETAPVTATTTSYYTITQTATATTTSVATSTVTATAPTTVTVTQTVTPTSTTTVTSTSTSTSTTSPDDLVPDYTPGTQACPKPAVGFVAQHGQLRTSGGKIVDIHGQPVILRGMSLFWSQWMGQFWNSGVVNTLVNDWRVNVVRAAMGIEMGGYLENPVAEKQKVLAVIEAALDQGIYVIIDWHDHNANQHQTQSIQFFNEIASTYGNCPHIIFETFNEPEWQDWATQIKPYHEAVVSSIRTKSQNLAVLGSRMWSQSLDEVAANPLNTAVYKNVAYTVHFYAATHKQWNRDLVQTAVNANIPMLASECGLSEASGNGYVDTNEFNTWVSFLESNHIGWLVWSIADKAESSAALKPGSSPNGGWTTASYTQSGLHVYNTIRSKQ